MIQEFKNFALRGNVIDLAVGIIIGGAFGTIVTSLVNDVLTPLIGMLTGGLDFSGLALTLGGDAKIMYGKFLQASFSFVIVAWSLFVLVKAMNKKKCLRISKFSLRSAIFSKQSSRTQERRVYFFIRLYGYTVTSSRRVWVYHCLFLHTP
jgi:large conductance mechanosensitive channel